MDIVMVAIGLLIYVQFDLYPILPISLPDNWDFFEPVVASIGLAILAYGGISLIVALVEMTIWTIKDLLSKISKNLRG